MKLEEAEFFLDLAEKIQDNVKSFSFFINAFFAADEIIKYAKENDVDLIVVGTKGRSRMRKALLGSVASKIATYSPCSVLVVR